jgi:spore maturation protein CgeB
LKILFVAALHHPTALQAAVEATPPGETPPLFPPSMAQHFYERELRARGYVLEVFYRNIPAWGGKAKAQRHSSRLTPGKLISAAGNRLPPRMNPDYVARNAALMQRARSFKPDVLWMVGDNTVIYAETIATIKQETGCTVIYASGTSPIVFSHAIERAAARLYDLVLVNDYYHGIQWLELGAKQMECLPIAACDPSFHHPYALSVDEQLRYRCDIAFVGTLVPNALYSERVKALEALRDFDLGIWSVHDVPASLKKYVRGDALGEDMLRILSAAKLTINTHGDFMRYGGNMRLFEAAGVGTLQLADDLPGNRQWFTPGETIVLYSSMNDLRAKAAYYLEQEGERTTIAQQARAHVYTHHTYKQRVDQLEVILGRIKAG